MTISNNQQQSATISNNQQQSATISNNQPDTTAQHPTLNTPHNATLIADKLTALRQILPEIFSETKLDFDKLRQLLGEHIADGERYGLNWAGKSHAYRTLQSPTNDTLAPCIDDSVDFDNTQNLFIESDNLQALKLLQKSYAGQIKMIYIDPPYNTGNDSFIYDDNFKQTIKDYEKSTGDRDDDGNRLRDFKKNSKDSGHYHSNWLNMMLPRLHLARTLLKDDGVIFISIDDNEQAQLKLLCDEIFGAENFIADFIWNNKYTVSNDTDVSYQHEHIICYSKNRAVFDLNLLPRTEKQNENYKNRDNDPKGKWKPTPIHARSGSLDGVYEIEFPNGVKWIAPKGRYPRYSKDRLLELYHQGALYFNKNGGVDRKTYLNEVRQGVTCGTLWSYDDVGHSHGNNEEFSDILGKGIFSDPKGLRLLSRIINLGSNKNDIILDFFAGSGTTAHAVMKMNSEDGGNRQFICVQLPEPTDSKSEAHKAGFNTIAEISKERIRRAGAKIGADNPDKNIDTGFKVFKLSSSNFKQWQSHDGMTADEFISQLAMFADSPLIENAVPIHVVYELLLRMGLKLTANIQEINGIYWIKCDTGNYAIILNKLDQDNMMAIINQRPNKTVMLDTVFETDSQKSNVILQFKDAGLDLETI